MNKKQRARVYIILGLLFGFMVGCANAADTRFYCGWQSVDHLEERRLTTDKHSLRGSTKQQPED